MDDLDLTGSPLCDDNSIHKIINETIAENVFLTKPWQDNEEPFGPIDINLGRKILMNIYNQYQQYETNENDWIFILTNKPGENSMKREFLLSNHLSKDEHVRGIATYHGIVKHKEKSAENLIKRHSSMIPNQKIEVKMTSSFELTENITLRFVNHSSNLSINHVDMFSEAHLFQRVRIGKFHENCEIFWSQIHLLNLIKNEIVNSRNRSVDGTLGMEPQYTYGLPEMNFDELQKKVNKILTDITGVEENEQDSRNNLSIEDIAKQAKNRFLSDITYQLWDLLKFSASYYDLKRILTYIFQTSSRSGVVNVPTSHNRLSELIRDLSFQRLATPHLVGTEPLELLFEIGVEKLTEDFDYIFTQSKIGNINELEIGGKNHFDNANNLSVRKTLMNSANMEKKSIRKTLVKGASQAVNETSDDQQDEFKNSRFSEVKAEKSIAILAKTYLIIEHLISIQNNIPLKHDFFNLARIMSESQLNNFDELIEMKNDCFEFPINNKEVINLVEGLNPNSQKFVLSSSSKFNKITNYFLFNIEQIVPFLEGCEVKNDEVITNSSHFYSYSLISTNVK